uniref:Magnesium transporter n=1 Tax=Hanusia phi TaxID=3032 RepID=A0A7S0EXJ1_9CRYP|mmetsp:Transcript_33384/g.74855  ORF Transcript_33384/g.74855 Transcript_33384/m.74855 type:complete len:453 (+) Transcript_33384:41-1399(+)
MSSSGEAEGIEARSMPIVAFLPSVQLPDFTSPQARAARPPGEQDIPLMGYEEANEDEAEAEWQGGSRRRPQGDQSEPKILPEISNHSNKVEDCLTVLEVLHDMQSHIRFDVNRSQILEFCLLSSSLVVDSTVFEQDLKQLVINAWNAQTSVVQLRDIRFVMSKSEPVILIRQGVILVSFDPIKAVISCRKSFVIIPEGADEVLEPLKRRLAAVQNDSKLNSIPFEFGCLEAILITLAALKKRDVNHCLQEGKTILRLVRKKMSSRLLNKILALKKKLSEIYESVVGCVNALEEVQDSDTQMALMYLTQINNNPKGFLEALRQGSWNTDEVELLLDSYSQDLSAMASQLNLLDQEIESTEALMKLKLDTARNTLIKVDVSFGIASLWLTACSLISGYYGMNLQSGHQNDMDHPLGESGPSTMWLEVTIISSVGCIFMIATSLVSLWCCGLFRS